MTAVLVTGQYIAIDRAVSCSRGVFERSKLIQCKNTTFNAGGAQYDVQVLAVSGGLSGTGIVNEIMTRIRDDEPLDINTLLKRLTPVNHRVTCFYLGLWNAKDGYRVYVSRDNSLLDPTMTSFRSYAVGHGFSYIGDPKHYFKLLSDSRMGVSASYDEWGMRPEFKQFSSMDGTSIPRGVTIKNVPNLDSITIVLKKLGVTAYLYGASQSMGSVSDIIANLENSNTFDDVLAVLSDQYFNGVVLYSDGFYTDATRGKYSVSSVSESGQYIVNGRPMSLGEETLMRKMVTSDLDYLVYFNRTEKKWLPCKLFPRNVAYMMFPDKKGNMHSGYIHAEDLAPIKITELKGVVTHSVKGDFVTNIEAWREEVNKLLNPKETTDDEEKK